MAKSYFLMGEAEKCTEVLDEAKAKMPGHLEMIDGQLNNNCNDNAMIFIPEIVRITKINCV